MKIRQWNRLNKADKIKAVKRLKKEIGSLRCSEVERNIQAFDACVRQTVNVLNAGQQRYSMRAILYYLRHHTLVSDSGITFKINNNLSPSFSRAAMALFDDLPEKFFELRGE